MFLEIPGGDGGGGEHISGRGLLASVSSSCERASEFCIVPTVDGGLLALVI